MTAIDLCPPAPNGVPADFAKPSGSYRLQAVGVLAGLIAFVLIYFALIAGVAWLGFWIATNPPEIPKGRGGAMVIIAFLGGLVSIGMLLLFLVKGLFKGTKTDRSTYVQVTRKEQPVLFEFIDRICAETAAPKPAGVFISPDVNAAVFYDTSLINLLIPPRKYLLIGAGLVEAVNLREFKAVLAHEFGHFSQKSLAIGTYVWVANRVLGDMIYGRDSWDRVLGQWCSLDIRISFPGWILRGVVWVLRSSLGAIFKLINGLNSSLSRQMEFNADDVAVSVAGSDAIVTTLCKVEFADHCFAASARELATATDHNLYSENIFFHQTAAAGLVRKQAKKAELGIPPEPPNRVFEPNDDSDIPLMWQSHPANHLREANAKREYFAAPPDIRSPWLLFKNPKALQTVLSHTFYTHVLEKPTKGDYVPATTVQAFIESERAETQYDPKYHGLFDDRSLAFADLPNVPEVDPRPDAVERLAMFFNRFPRADLERRMTVHFKRREEISHLVGVHTGQKAVKGNKVNFRGEDVPKSVVPKLLDELCKEIDDDHKEFKQWDVEMYIHHYQAAHRLDPARAIDLRRRYVFQKSVQDMVLGLNAQENNVSEKLMMASGGELNEDQFRELRETLQSARDDLARVLSNAKSIVCPDMFNVSDGTKLIDLLKLESESTKLPRFDSDGGIQGENIGKMMTALQTVLTRLRRVYFKGLGNVLTKQEQIASDFRQQFAAT